MVVYLMPNIVSFTAYLRLVSTAYGAGFGFGCAYMVASLAVTLQFHGHKWQSFAISFATSGVNTGTMAIPLLSQLFLNKYGWRGAYLLLSGVTLQGAVCAIMLINLNRKGINKKEELTKIVNTSLLIRVKEIFENKDFDLFLISGSFTAFGYLIPYIMIPDLIKERGFTDDQSALVITMSGFAGIPGRLLAGFLIDFLHLSRIMVHAVLLLIGSMATALCVHMEDYWMLLVYGGILGVFTGVFGFLHPAIVNDLLENNVEIGFGFCGFFEGIAVILGPPIAGLIADAEKQYHGAFYFAGSMFFLGSVSACVLYMKKRLYKNSYTFSESIEQCR